MSALSDALEKANDLITTYEKVAASSIPGSIKAAKDWDLKIDGIDVSLETEYPGGAEQRKLDKQRLVTLEGAVLILAEMEADILDATVKTQRQIIYAAFQPTWLSILQTAQDWAEDTITAIILSGGPSSVIDAVEQLLARCYEIVLTAFAVAQLASGIKDGIKIRNSTATRMRKQALKQKQSAPRYRVKRSHRV